MTINITLMNKKEYLSKEEIKKYLNSEMNETEMHNVELKIEEDSFSDSAFEGYRSNPEALEDLDLLKNKFQTKFINSRTRSSNFKIIYSAAAILIVVLLSYFFINTITENSDPGISEHIEPSLTVEEPKNQPEEKKILTEKKPVIINKQSETPRKINKKSDNIKKVVSIPKRVNSKVEVDLSSAKTEKIEDSNTVLDGSDVELIVGESDVLVFNSNIVSSDKINVMNGSNSLAMAPSYTSPEVNVIVAEGLYEIAIVERSENQSVSITYLYDLKIIDYTLIYDGEIRNYQQVQHGGVNASQENSKRNSTSLAQEIVIEYITYADFLEESISLYKSAQYENTLDNFKIILKEHPEELNAWFYSALSCFELGDYVKAVENFNYIINHPINEFDQEAEWYKVLSLIKLNSFEEASVLLNKIIKDSLFYHDKAKTELDNLNPE